MLITLIAELIFWVVQGRPIYPSMTDRTIPFISDVSAASIKPLFMAGCIISSVSFFFAYTSDVWAPETGRLVPGTPVRCQWFWCWCARLSIAISAAGLCLLSGFDVENYPNLHQNSIYVFVLGYVLFNIATLLEYRILVKGEHFRSKVTSWLFTYLRQLADHKREYPILIRSFIIKCGLSIMIVCQGAEYALFNKSTWLGVENAAVVLEWVIGLIFSLYMGSFFLEMRFRDWRVEKIDDAVEDRGFGKF